jgi:hypothetical protein
MTAARNDSTDSQDHSRQNVLACASRQRLRAEIGIMGLDLSNWSRANRSGG